MRRLELHRLDYAAAVGFLAYAASAVVTPICLLQMAGDLSFSLTGGGGIEVARSALILIVLFLSGFVAARWGKIRSLGAGAFVLGAGMLLYAAAPHYGVVLVAAALGGFGSGVLEGLINPLVQQLHPDDSGRYLNVINGFWSVGVMGTVLIVGELLTRGVSWRLIMGATGLLSFVSGALFLFHSPHGEARPATAKETHGHLLRILRTPRFWVFASAIFLAGGAEMAFTFWSASYIQLCYRGIPRAGGIGTACFAGGMLVGRFASGHAVEQKGLRRLILLSAAGGFVVSLFVPAVTSLRGLYLLLGVAGLATACFWPSLQSYAADCLQVDSTMLFILLSCAGIPGCAFATWLMGCIGDLAGLRVSFFVIPVLFALLLALLLSGPGREKAAAPSR